MPEKGWRWKRCKIDDYERKLMASIAHESRVLDKEVGVTVCERGDGTRFEHMQECVVKEPKYRQPHFLQTEGYAICGVPPCPVGTKAVLSLHTHPMQDDEAGFTITDADFIEAIRDDAPRMCVIYPNYGRDYKRKGEMGAGSYAAICVDNLKEPFKYYEGGEAGVASDLLALRGDEEQTWPYPKDFKHQVQRGGPLGAGRFWDFVNYITGKSPNLQKTSFTYDVGESKPYSYWNEYEDFFGDENFCEFGEELEGDEQDEEAVKTQVAPLRAQDWSMLEGEGYYTKWEESQDDIEAFIEYLNMKYALDLDTLDYQSVRNAFPTATPEEIREQMELEIIPEDLYDDYTNTGELPKRAVEEVEYGGYACPICFIHTADSTGLFLHMMQEHGDIYSPADIIDLHLMAMEDAEAFQHKRKRKKK